MSRAKCENAGWSHGGARPLANHRRAVVRPPGAVQGGRIPWDTAHGWHLFGGRPVLPLPSVRHAMRRTSGNGLQEARSTSPSSASHLGPVPMASRWGCPYPQAPGSRTRRSRSTQGGTRRPRIALPLDRAPAPYQEAVAVDAGCVDIGHALVILMSRPIPFDLSDD